MSEDCSNIPTTRIDLNQSSKLEAAGFPPAGNGGGD
jgi:hypothetical protein